MSSSEMKDFVLYFGFIVGDDVANHTPEGDNPWDLFVELRRIFGLIFLPKVTKGTISQLKRSIKDHHEIYLKLFGKLKPKFHFLLHYPNLLQKFGPFLTYWCMRYESRHRELKATSYSTSGNKNSLLTVATKEMLKLCNLFHTLENKPSLNFGYIDSYKCNSDILTSINEDILVYSQFFCSVNVLGEDYYLGDILLVETEPSLIFGKIVKIIFSKERLYFTLELYEQKYFNYIYQAYNVIKTNVVQTFAFETLPEYPPCLFYDQEKDLYVLLPHDV